MTGKLKKQLGQYILSDGPILSRIAEATKAGPGDAVLEIGPGTGNLTDRLLRTGAHVTAVELDVDMCERLATRFADEPRLEVIHGDFLKVDLAELAGRIAPGKRMIVAGNLPYYITTPIIMHMLEHGHLLSRMVLLVQEEMGMRISAQPGDRNRGSLTVAYEVIAECTDEGRVGRDSFQPVPKVDSMIVRLEMRSCPVHIADPAHFEKVARAAFKHPRKTCYNSLRICLGNGFLTGYTGEDPERTLREAFRAADIPLGIRTHFLTFGQLARLADCLAGEFQSNIGETQ